MGNSQQDQWKKEAATEAARRVESGMLVGLGTGSTAALFLEALAQRIHEENLGVSGIPTSERTAQLARQLGIPLTTFAEKQEIDLTVDGADEVERGTLYLIKGHGGALLREKIVAAASKRMIVIADETKLVDRLGSLVSVPVEVVQFGWQATQNALAALGGKPAMRRTPDGATFLTDSGNFILDCAFGAMDNPKETAHHLDHVVGAIEHGLFLKLASEVIVGTSGGTKILTAS